jgi:hypothetical protein
MFVLDEDVGKVVFVDGCELVWFKGRGEGKN